MSDIERWIERLLADLETAGIADAAIVLHGSAARGQYLAGWSDVNLLMVLGQLSPDHLGRMGPALARWQKDAEAMPLLFTRAEWARAADTYPLEIADMRTGYRVLRGADPLEGMTVRAAELRLALERELRGTLLRLRRGYALYGDRPEMLAEGSRQMVSSLLVLLRGLIVLAGGTPPQDPTETISTAAELAGFEPAPLSRIVTRRLQSDWKLSREEFAGLLAAVEQAARFVDHSTHGEAS
jgi:predicted nucleotidyltransferase